MPELWLGRGEGRVAIEADSLVTHAACIGMTGSGKTGLCVGLLEEVAAAGVPILAIDPKGDLANLALTEPEGAASAAWRRGQESWGIAAPDVAAWRDRVAVRIWTPGSDAGLGLDLLGAMAPPPDTADEETRRELLMGVTASLLGLVGVEADPLRSPAHVVLARVLADAWAAGRSPALEELLAALIEPAFDRVGVLPLETFFPSDKRLQLAMLFNAMVASPSFAAWSNGAPLSVPELVAPREGRTAVNVFSLAHLGEGERQFFVALLLERVVAWSRTLAGTSRLRALVFFDEVWGFLPPHPHDPPTKRPLLTLLKQARAVGVGTVLATQNPVDIDYKALSNCGTWLIGRLQTRNDRDRVREGVGQMEARAFDALLDGLAARRFALLRPAKAPVTFETRWTRCFLAGPLPRARIRELCGKTAEAAPAPPARPAAPPRAAFPEWPGPQWTLRPGALQDALAVWRTPGPPWRAAFLVELRVRHGTPRAPRDYAQTRLFFPLDDALPIAPLLVEPAAGEVDEEPPAQGEFAPVPAWMDDLREVHALARRVAEEAQATEVVLSWANPPLKLTSHEGESREAFDARCADAVAARVEAAASRDRATAQKKLATLDDRITKVEARLRAAETTASGRETEELLHAGEALVGLFTGRRKSLTSFATRRRMSVTAGDRAEDLRAEAQALRAEAFALEGEAEARLAEARRKEERALVATETREARPRSVEVLRTGLLWVNVGG